MKNQYCIIMAGGVGTRFWPMSTTGHPKQFLDILGTGKTLIQQTFDRFLELCPPQNIYVVTSDIYEQLVCEQLPNLPKENILTEPSRKNTAPCIAYASYKINKLNPNAITVVAPSDHLISIDKGRTGVIELTLVDIPDVGNRPDVNTQKPLGGLPDGRAAYGRWPDGRHEEMVE